MKLLKGKIIIIYLHINIDFFQNITQKKEIIINIFKLVKSLKQQRKNY